MSFESNRIKSISILCIPLMVLSFVGITSCDDIEEVIPIIDSTAGQLPLLKKEKDVGMIIGFNSSHPESTIDSIDARWEEAKSLGMSVGRLQIDWEELETSANVYDKSVLESQLAEMQEQNLQTFLLISAYDSEGPLLPQDLEGLSFDEPAVIDRFNQLMDWVIPMLVEYEGYLISITNEADNNFGEIPNLHEDILEFVRNVRQHIHSINKNIAVTVTFAEGSLASNNKPGIKEILQECDVACWNFYGSKATLLPPFTKVKTRNQVRRDIQKMLQFSGEKNIIIQELGLHAGENILNSSEELQQRFFETFFQEMNAEPRIKTANIFQLVDWSPDVIDFYLQVFEGEDIQEIYVEALGESLATIGLIHYEDGRRKLAWNEVTKWIEEFN